jgi:hypothetical protein
MKKRLAVAIIAAASAAHAQAPNPDVIWRGDFSEGPASLTGHCKPGQNQWCATQLMRPEQIQVVPDPLNPTRPVARFEVKHGDAYKNYTDTRALVSGPPQLWEDEGSERWYRFQVMWPENWVGRYPKWDQLNNGNAYSDGGSVVEWHHDAGGRYETGSAPLYFKADDHDILMCLVDQATSTCREQKRLAPLQRGKWHDFVVHAKWSSNPAVGLLEVWLDGQSVARETGANKYPGMKNYLLVGLYRNGHIGDPALLAPNGLPVYGSDGAAQQVYVAGFVAGTTEASVKQ